MRFKYFLLLLTVAGLVVVSISRGADFSLSPYIDTAYVYVDPDTLTVDGYSDVVQVVGARVLVAEIDVAALGDTLFASLWASNDEVNWTNTDADAGSLAFVSTGTYGLVFPYAEVYRYYRIWYNEIADGAKAVTRFRAGGATNAQ